MAIGLGKMFGFHFEENFNYPYISKSVSEFWRRWHISLSTWFREYVYFPLGGSRVENKDKMVRNLLVVWLLTGLWHGANWTFVFWGLFNFVCLLLERLFLLKMEGASGLEALVYHADGELRLGIIPKRKLLSVPGISREYVRIEWERLFQRPGPYVFTGIRGVLGDWNTSLPAGRRLAEKKLASLPKLSKTSFAVVYPVGMAGLFFVCVTYLVRSGYNPFIYFNF